MELTVEAVSFQQSRDRLVSFRLAPDEFSTVVEACADTGARSLSDFARQALLRHVEYGVTSLEGDLLTIARRLKEVDDSLAATRALIARALGQERSGIVQEAMKNGHRNGNGDGT